MPSDGLSFEERRKQLRQLLNDTHMSLYLEHEQTYDHVKRDRLWDTLSVVRRMFQNTFNRPEFTTSDWFWESIAISADNPRQMSYTWEPDWRTLGDDKRKRSSIGNMLKTAVHKGLCDFSREDIDRLAHAVGTYFPDTLEYSFRVVSGEGVCEAYRDSPDRWGSCMSRHWDDFVRWYAENPERVSLVRIERGSEYCGRALLWTLDGDKGMFLDRVYPSDSGPAYQALIRHAKEQGWYTRSDLPRSPMVTMRPPLSGEFPYLDTFRYTDDDPGDSDKITLNTSNGNYEFSCTDGGYEGDSYETCRDCGGRVDEDDCYYSENGHGPFCQSCYSDRYVYLSYRNAMTGDRREGEYSRDEVTCCDECREDRDSDDVSEVDGRQVCCNCFEDCVCNCAKCDYEILTANATEHKHNVYCSECYEEVTKCLGTVNCECDDCTAVPEGQLALPINLNEEEDTNDAAAQTDTGGETGETQTAENSPHDLNRELSWSTIIAGFPHRPGNVPAPLA